MSTDGGRPRLNLKPRDPEAAKKAEAEREAKLKASPFGSAKPREQTLASRTGKSEEEILRDAIKQERLRLRLNPQQMEEKAALEALVDEVKEQLAMETQESNRAALTELLKQREAAVDQLLDRFSHEALDAAQRGEVQRPSERRAMQQLTGQDGMYGADAAYGGGPAFYGGGGGRGGGYGGGGRGYNPTRDHDMGGRGGGRGRTGYMPTRDHVLGGGGARSGSWGSAAPFDDGYLPGMPAPPALDPNMVDYHSPFPAAYQDRF
ncbi:hypothetical protein DUNSADRAFT_15767 [Dunaliella salina]|uniref:Uncharacterized protein n=1 Tax=Dunaliella salina TaxID=3046 RepID=A0ABQ7H9E0_DUNSA|nr:hypothetical protein DUNSADRAFT_15767 [Dunaliella salina]|eukprot:KAF5843472.1 hypothetical protein DUNSADRAFT_15767 [Dunaliella salina]